MSRAGATASAAGGTGGGAGGGGGQGVPESSGAGGRGAVRSAASSFLNGRGGGGGQGGQGGQGGRQQAPAQDTGRHGSVGGDVHDAGGEGGEGEGGRPAFDPLDDIGTTGPVHDDAGQDEGGEQQQQQGKGGGAFDAFADAFGLSEATEQHVDALARDFDSMAMEMLTRGRRPRQQPRQGGQQQQGAQGGQAGQGGQQQPQGFRVSEALKGKMTDYFGDVDGPKLAAAINELAEFKEKHGQAGGAQQQQADARGEDEGEGDGPQPFAPFREQQAVAEFAPFFEARSKEGFGDLYDTPGKQVQLLKRAAMYKAFKASKGVDVTDDQAMLVAHASASKGRRAGGKTGEQVLGQIRTRSRQVDAAPAGGSGGHRPQDTRRSLLGAARSYLQGQSRRR